MAQKQTILGRVATLARANVNALLDRAENPEKMLDQLVRDYSNAIADAEQAVAQSVASLRMAEQDHAQDVSAAEDWGRKALAASQKADELRASNPTEADKFDRLARVAIEKQMGFENDAKQAEPLIAQQNEVVGKLKDGLAQMKSKLNDLKSRRDTLVARSKNAAAQEQLGKAMGSISILDPSSELSRFEDKVRRQEALVQGRAEVAAASIDSQFEELEQTSANAEIEARLAALKGGSQSTPALSSGQQGTTALGTGQAQAGEYKGSDTEIDYDFGAGDDVTTKTSSF